MVTIFTALVVCGVIWGGFTFLILLAIKKEKEKSKNGFTY